MRTLDDLDLSGKRVLVRVDFNVPLDENGNVKDDRRIRAAIPTIKAIMDKGGKPILVSHLGRPKGKPDPGLSMAPVARRLGELLGATVKTAPDCVGPEAEKAAASLGEGEVLLLENVRFHEGETKNDPGFAKQLAALADAYVNDAFGTAHRAHASTEGVARLLPSAGGLLIQKEMEYLGGVLADPDRPFAAILGGAKVSDKIPVIKNLLDKVDTLIIGGAMAYTFLKAAGAKVGASRVEEDMLDLARELSAKAEERGVRFLLPVDHVCGRQLAPGTETMTTDGVDIPDGWMGLDIGPQTVEEFAGALAAAHTVVWNGPVGAFETKPFDAGTRRIAETLASSNATTICGGGDTAAAVREFGLEDKFSHISTGGGASLELLEGKVLPGIAVLS